MHQVENVARWVLVLLAQSKELVAAAKLLTEKNNKLYPILVRSDHFCVFFVFVFSFDLDCEEYGLRVDPGMAGL